MSPSVADRPFRKEFWFAYLANSLLMVSVSIMYRYADFVTSLGGDEFELGWIVGVGMLGAISMRLFQAVSIDHYGAGRIWIGSVLLVSLSLLWHLRIDDVHSAEVYLARIIYTTALAGSFGASITFVSLRAPRSRTAEVIGSLGSSGFVGMAIGPVIADWLFRGAAGPHVLVDRMFTAAAMVAGVSFLATLCATHGERGPNSAQRRLPVGRVLWRYFPGALLVVAFAMGLGIGIPFSFARTFAAELNIEGIGAFFLTYSLVAFAVRVMFRRLPDQWGFARTLLLGLVCLSASMLSYLLVAGPWTLMIPATLGGIAHAFAFPAAVAGGSLAYPRRYRGLATTLVLTMFDLGTLVGQPVVGSLVHFAKRSGWPAYPTMFLAVSIFLMLVGIVFAWRRELSAQRPRPRRRRTSLRVVAAVRPPQPIESELADLRQPLEQLTP